MNRLSVWFFSSVSFTDAFMQRLCYTVNQCTTLREVHLNILNHAFFGGDAEWTEFGFILSPTISRCTHFTLGGISSARLFAIHTLAPISASCGLSHLSLQMPSMIYERGIAININGNQVGTMLETINLEAANQVKSLSLRNGSNVFSNTNFWLKEHFHSSPLHSMTSLLIDSKVKP